MRMGQIIALLLVCVCGVARAAGPTWAGTECQDGAPSNCEKSVLPAGIVRLIPGGYEVLDYLGGQLTDVRRQDYLVVIHHHVDTMQHASPRALLIFTQNADGSYTLAARNDAVIMQADEGGMGDPYDDSGDDGLVIKNRYFTIQQGVSAGISHYTDYITFHYVPKYRNWLFHNEIFTDIQPSLEEPPKPIRTVITRANRGHPVSFADWRPDDWCDPGMGHQNEPACRNRATDKGRR